MQRIPLSNCDAFALVDDEDFLALRTFTWRITRGGTRGGYATRTINFVDENGTNRVGTILMHRQILSATPGSLVDHINYDRLDNRRSNLRFATRAQNAQHRSGCVGVTLCRGKWQAQIVHLGKYRYLGRFENFTAAKAARDAAAADLFGSFTP